MPDITAKSWTRFITTNFCVTAKLMGDSHEFVFENHNILVRLPKPEDADRDSRFDKIAHASSWRADTNEPLLYQIEKIDLEIEVPNVVSVPNEALNNPLTQMDHFSKEQQDTVDNICESHSRMAERAFDYWLEIVRWASGSAMIGQPSISNANSGWATYIMDASTNHRVWARSKIFIMQRQHEVTEEHWALASEHLKNGDNLPMHLRFLHDAEASSIYGHYEKSILELAMACEIYLRYSVFKFIPQNTPKELSIYIEEANINKYSSKFFKSLVSDSHKVEYKKLAKEISSLMSRRNSYVHMGKMDEANETLCRRFINAMKALFNIELSNENS